MEVGKGKGLEGGRDGVVRTCMVLAFLYWSVWLPSARCRHHPE